MRASWTYTIQDNGLVGSRRVKSAKLSFIKAKIIRLSRTINTGLTNHAERLRIALKDEYRGNWFVYASKVDQYFSISQLMLVDNIFEYLDLSYKGIDWSIMRVE